MHIPLLDLKREFAEIRDEVFAGWNGVLESMKLLKGENLQAFEEEVAAYLGIEHAVGVASGTDALTLGLLAAGIGPGDEVIVQANAFAAAAEACRIAGAAPVPIDIRESDLGPDLDQLEDAITDRTAALIVVHMYGLPVALDAIREVIEPKGILLVEDASHAHGATYRGRKAGTFGRVGCFSCGPVKNLGCYGDGGFVATDDGGVAEKVRLLQAHGQAKKNEHQLYGFNSRLDELQAVVLRAKLKRLDRRNALRVRHAERYNAALRPLGIITPPVFPDRTCSYHQYVIRAAERDRLAAFLKGRGIGTGVHYNDPIHKQAPWKATWGTEPKLPVSEKVAGEILSLPVYPDLTNEEVEHIIESVGAFVR
ncbi:MAG: DegT/DnrJ/EryC1/StrS family aminotransferase [Planctomycetota bacterium]